MASATETTQVSPKGSGITGWFKKSPGMDKGKMDELLVSSRAAYDAELAGQWLRAYNLHTKAAEMWSDYAQTAGRFNNIEKIYKRLAIKRAELHRQRLDTLRPFAKDGSPVPEVVPMHPSSELLQIGLWDKIRTEDVPVRPNMEPEVLSLTRQELATPGRAVPDLPQYTATLPRSLPADEFTIRYRRETAGARMQLTHRICTLLDAKTGNELLILEGWSRTVRREQQITEALVYRPAEYPSPAFRVVPGAWRNGMTQSMVLTTHAKDGLLSQPVVEVPDRLGRLAWGPRRFVYGGRRFVRKETENPGRIPKLVPEAVFEYSTTTPRPGSKTGKLDDDALDTGLFWVGATQFKGHAREWACTAAAGLDPLFREYLCAAQMMKLLIKSSPGAAPTRTAEEIADAEAAQAAWFVGKALVKLVFALSGAL